MSSSTPPQVASPNSQDDAPKKWYREFWAWFILSPLIVVVIVSSYTVSLAVSNADDRVIDNYYKEGRMINIRLDEDLAAAELDLIATIHFDQSIGELTILLEQNTPQFPEVITLELSHPSNQDYDHEISLKHIYQGQYQAEIDKVLSYRWYLRLRPEVAANQDKPVAEEKSLLWRLRGEMDFAQASRVRLQSDL